MNPLISICIPAYKNVSYVQRLLHSISIQSFKDFEVVMSDDSPTDEVEILCREYSAEFPLVYQRNSPAKGTPANWNTAIRKARGEWIKIMHDDDWFATAQSLEIFAKAIKENPEAGFIFSGYSDYEDGELKYTNILSDHIKRKLSKSSLTLFVSNYIGNPSTTLIKNDQAEWYDEKLKWVVDFEYYIRCLRTKKIYGIPSVLVCVGFNKDMVTKKVFRDPAVEIPENIYMLNKLGPGILKNIRVYDYYWRIFRNLGMRDFPEIEKHLSGNELPEAIKKMLRFQFKIPLSILKIGPLSKFFMSISYINK